MHVDFYSWIQEQAVPFLDPATRANSTSLWDGFLATEANFRFIPVLIHRDLGGEHILCTPDGSGIAGVIDWGDVAIGDPAMDFVGLFILNPDMMEQVLLSYDGQIDESFRQRIDFYAKVGPFHEIRYGLQTGQKQYIESGVQGVSRRLVKE